MCRFDPHPGLANSIGPRKRPLNNVAPTIVRLADRDAGVGLRGGRRIVSVSAQLCRRIVEQGASPLQAAVAPRMHVTAQEPVEVTESLDQPVVAALVKMGHQIETVPAVAGSAHLVLKNGAKIRAGGNVWAAGAGR
jgi:gamma-glutamyltranspeptidase/glutathione hydrolase